ncbi:MAG: FG-GAP repeat protein [Proteobacteria bacterium]|nr:FG-GAP repeat protein [Pseudomonadota bacterium]
MRGRSSRHDDRFGRSVSIKTNGQTIAVSAPRHDTPRGDRPALISSDDDIHDAGSVFIYNRPSTGE